MQVLNIDTTVRRLINAAIDRCGKTRHEIAAEMSKSLGVTVTKAMLDGWVSEHKRRLRFPVAFVEAFCRATGDDQLQRFSLGRRLRRALVVGEGELAKMEVRRLQRRRRKKKP